MAKAGNRPIRPHATLHARDADTLAANFLEPATMQAIYEEVRTLLEASVDEETVIGAGARAIELGNEIWDDLQSDAPSYDCRKGCSWCCYQAVMVTAPEVFVALTYLRTVAADETPSDLGDRLRDRSARIAGKTTGERMLERIACGFLVDGMCSLHPARPLTCRGAYSSDEAFCRRLFDDYDAAVATLKGKAQEEPFLILPKLIYNSTQMG